MESTIVFDAIKYLDRYLSIENVEQLNRFQLVGLGCLRAAIQDRGNRPAHCDTKENLLEAKNYSYISDNIYKPEEVEEMTEAVSSAIPLALKKAANSKMFLRSLWFRATNRNVAASDEMHIYILASFLVKLSLLDLSCSGFAPSLISAAAMSLALSYFGKPAWPTALRSFVAYTHADLESARMQLANAQAHSIATNLRSAWSRIYAENRNSISEQYSEQWRRAHQLFAFPSTALLDIIRNPAMSSLEEKERSHFRPKRLENILSLASQVDAKTVNQHLSDNGEDLASVDASSQSTQTAMEL